ncbi:MAG: integral rane sensor signal transduction histidine kinase, partial [Myxococcales bacterium]|nr:integral rane sensor signal transduction histidine kinase [Myxococcales bacterium]
TLRRLPPLAAAFALMAAALVATAWSTRSTVIDASSAVRDGYAIALQQAVRADFAELGGPPGDTELAAMLAEHEGEGLRYIATLDNHGRVTSSAGKPVGETIGRSQRKIEHVGDRIRVEMRTQSHRAWGSGGRPWWIVLEIDPSQGDELLEAATWTLAVGGIAALTLLGVAIALVRRELRRSSEQQKRERERRLASLGEMSAVLAHEIRNPLASLKGNAQLLAAMLPADDKPRAKAERVVDEALRLEKLTTELLTFVRTGELQRAAVDPAQLVRDASVDLAVEVAAIGAPSTWSLDGGRMREVIVNLLDNAVAAGPPVTAAIRTEDGKLVIEISDRGPGVPAADREKIFEPFFTGKTRGTGLGLAIARRIVELHRGTITVGDASGGGAKFRIEIPEA